MTTICYFCFMKKIAAIHDLSGFGRASLTVAIPILSYMGYQVCPLPTAVLSAHSEYEGFRSFDLTEQMQPIIEHWKELHLHFDALYSIIRDTNIASQRVAVRNGMRPIDTLIKHYRGIDMPHLVYCIRKVISR